MKAVLGKDKKPKKGDVVQFGMYDDQPIKWHVLETDARSHKALLFADSYCGKATATTDAHGMEKIYEAITNLMKECFSSDEQELICEIRLLTDDDCQIFSIEKNELKFFPFGEDNEASEWWHNGDFTDTGETLSVGMAIIGCCLGLPRPPTTKTRFLRPVMWIKYDCVPAEKDTGKEQK